MRRSIVVAFLAVAVLAGCGNDTCTSSPAKLDAALSSPSCTLRPGATAVIQVPLCSRCNDSAPDCQAEVLGNRIEVQPVVQQCQDQSGCATSGCNATVRTASCTFNTPALSGGGAYQLVVVGDTVVQGTLTLSAGGGTSCSL